jgi:hypothetical protein
MSLQISREGRELRLNMARGASCESLTSLWIRSLLSTNNREPVYSHSTGVSRPCRPSVEPLNFNTGYLMP